MKTTKFKVGDTVWWAKCRWEVVNILCPTCFGKRQVTLILGNGDSVILPCKGCSPGYEPPSGYISEYDYVSDPEMVSITGMEIEVNGDKEKVRYRSSFNIYDEEELFTEHHEALDKSREKKLKLEEDQRTRAEYIKEDVHKSFSWNARYHIREAKSHREQAEYHGKMAVICKAKISAVPPAIEIQGEESGCKTDRSSQ